MKYFLGGATLAFMIFVCTAEAATLYIDPNTAELNRGDAITVSVRLDTDEASGECINAIDGVLTYSESIIPVDISIGESIFPVWVETPTINKENRTITFAGGIPNGYCGRVQGDPNLTNTVVELVFRSPGIQIGSGEDSAVASVSFTPATTAYINDGLGTKATLETYGTTFSLSSVVGSEIVDEWRDEVQADTVPPEAFSITLERDTKTFAGKAYIVFNTTDKQTGISHYEVIEESSSESKLFRFGAANNPWIETRSPYVLTDQTLSSLIRVRAIDKAGNEYIATLLPDESMRANSGVKLWYTIGVTIGVISLIALILLMVWLQKRRRKEEVIHHDVQSAE